MDRREAHFIGGPRDGQSMFLKDESDYYEVALIPEVSRAFDPADADVCTTSCERFTYQRVRIHRDAWVYVPNSWHSQYGIDLEEHVMDVLVRGYIGNKST